MSKKLEEAQEFYSQLQNAETDRETEFFYYKIKDLLTEARDACSQAKMVLTETEEGCRRLELLTLLAAEARLQKIKDELSSSDR